MRDLNPDRSRAATLPILALLALMTSGEAGCASRGEPAGDAWSLASAVGGPDAPAALVIEDVHGRVVDLEGLALRGAEPGTDLDRLTGTAILVRRCSDLVIRDASIGGFRAGVVVEQSRDVVLEDLRFEGWFGQRLGSTPEAEDPSDWLWPHENDAGEWLASYGAAISVTDGERVTIRRCRGRRGQNGILLTRCADGEVYDNDFSFLSGWGLAMYRSSGHTVARNRFDYCVRGYSHGVYWRGQDSAGILMFERCTDNVVALNSATHGGDGLFLYAGQDLVEGRALARGETDVGGSDRNLFWHNDFSFAVANAFEGTFSEGNLVIGNRLDGCAQHGIWGGYSSRMVIVGNTIRDNPGGIAIEHGRAIVIGENEIAGNERGIELWWDPDPQFVEGPFGEQRDTSSRGYQILRNRFADNGRDLVVSNTDAVAIEGNLPRDPEIAGEQVTRLAAPGDSSELLLSLANELDLADLPGRSSPFEPDGPRALEGRETIVMGEWGPWDFESGAPRPAPRARGGLLAGARWNAVWFDWGVGPDPREDLVGWRALEGSAPLASDPDAPAWSGPWTAAAPRERVGSERFGLRATTTVEIGRPGRYRLEVLSDDGVRVAVDGVTVLENWTWHAPTRDEIVLSLPAGACTLELEYFQIDGAAALGVELERLPPD